MNEPPGDAPPLIMVVDDDWLNRELMESIFTSQGYDVVLAHSGEQALKLAAERLPNLVLVDIRMPDMNGYEVCKRLKSSEATRQILVVLLSGNEIQAKEKAQAAETGADDILNRSLSLHDLTTRVEDLLRTRRQSGD